jgi:hypothetical protein
MQYATYVSALPLILAHMGAHPRLIITASVGSCLGLFFVWHESCPSLYK